MFHDRRDVKAMASGRPATDGSWVLAAVEAYCSIVFESGLVSKKLIDNTGKLWLSATTYKDAKDVCRATAAFVNASYRDVSENAEAMLRIWRRFIREAL